MHAFLFSFFLGGEAGGGTVRRALGFAHGCGARKNLMPTLQITF